MNTVQEVEVAPEIPDVRVSNTAVAEPVCDIGVSDPALDESSASEKSRRLSLSRKWSLRIGAVCVLALLIGLFLSRLNRPMEVALIEPERAAITEVVASSGRVGGAIETLVGAQASGIVDQIFVCEGDRVAAGQQLARLKNKVAEAQVMQAQASLDRARAEVAQTISPPLDSDLAAATEQVRQAEAQAAQQRASVTQAERGVARAQAQLRQREAERDLAAQQLTRTQTLAEQGVLSHSELDVVRRDFRVAGERVTEAQRSIDEADANVRSVNAGVTSAEASIRVQRARVRSVQIKSTPAEIEVARRRVAEAEQTLRIAQQQAENALVIAPFNATVTSINAELGQTVGAQGVLTLVSDVTEIRLSLDENNLADLRAGQAAVISSSAFPGSAFRGTVTEIAPSVDQERGTVEVTITPVNPPDWLRPGQTVNVNIITNEKAERLLVPATSISRAGDRSVVFVVEGGQAVERAIITRPPTGEGVPVLAGISSGDRIIADAEGVKAGDEVHLND